MGDRSGLVIVAQKKEITDMHASFEFKEKEKRRLEILN